MAFTYSNSAPGSGGGGGGVTIAGFENQQLEFTEDWGAGYVIALNQTPIDPQSVVIDYNGQLLLYGDDYTVSGSQVTMAFHDAYIPTYENPVHLQITYPY